MDYCAKNRFSKRNAPTKKQRNQLIILVMTKQGEMHKCAKEISSKHVHSTSNNAGALNIFVNNESVGVLFAIKFHLLKLVSQHQTFTYLFIEPFTMTFLPTHPRSRTGLSREINRRSINIVTFSFIMKSPSFSRKDFYLPLLRVRIGHQSTRAEIAPANMIDDSLTSPGA